MNTLSFVWRYLCRAYRLKSILCVGLDPTPQHVPPSFGTDISGMEKYLSLVIEAASTRVPVVKPQYAYYAALGPDGIAMMVRLIRYAHELGLLVILDAKRDDIGETMDQYGNEVFGWYGVDACTIVPYLGSVVIPWWNRWFERGRLAICMIRTSNKEAAELQDQKLEGGLFFYEFVAGLVANWNKKVADASLNAGGVGGVVGATWPDQAPRCRELAGDNIFFLIPGYGAQGGGAEGAVAWLPNSQNILMGTVNSSRGITLDSWFDREKKEVREGDPIKLMIKAIDDANADLNAALYAKFGDDIYEVEMIATIRRKND